MFVKGFVVWGLMLGATIGAPMPKPEPKPLPSPTEPSGSGTPAVSPTTIVLSVSAIVAGIATTTVVTCYSRRKKNQDIQYAGSDKSVQSAISAATNLMECLNLWPKWKENDENLKELAGYKKRVGDVAAQYAIDIGNAKGIEVQTAVNRRTTMSLWPLIMTLQLKTSELLRPRPAEPPRAAGASGAPLSSGSRRNSVGGPPPAAAVVPSTTPPGSPPRQGLSRLNSIGSTSSSNGGGGGGGSRTPPLQRPASTYAVDQIPAFVPKTASSSGSGKSSRSSSSSGGVKLATTPSPPSSPLTTKPTLQRASTSSFSVQGSSSTVQRQKGAGGSKPKVRRRGVVAGLSLALLVEA